MFAEFGPAPLCLELDFDSFDGPPHWVARLREKSGWLMVAEATIQSEHDILTDRLVVACDEQCNPIPSFKAANLIHCDWINPTYCDELPPDILEDLICEEEGALVARWHREKNTALAGTFEIQEIRICELEARAKSLIDRNELQIGQLRQRRRHPDATPEMRSAMAQVIAELDEENDYLLAEMADTRAVIREQAAEIEEALWGRQDLLIEVEPLHLVRWEPLRSGRYAPPYFAKPRTIQYVPASGRTGGSTRVFDTEIEKVVADLNRPKIQKKSIDAIPELPVAETEGSKARREARSDTEKRKIRLSNELARLQRLAKKLDHSKGAGRRNAERRREIEAEIAQLEQASKLGSSVSVLKPASHEIEASAATCWSPERVTKLKAMWLAGNSALEIAKALGDTSRNAVLGKADRLGLPRRADVIAGRSEGASTKAANMPLQQESQGSGANGSHWTPKRVALLKEHWINGTSAQDIADVLGLERGQVIGKAHRLGLSDKARPRNRHAPIGQRPENIAVKAHATPAPLTVQNALSALSVARKRYYGQD